MADYVGPIASRHVSYGTESRHMKLFFNSFLTAWKELFDDNYSEEIFNLWKRLIHEIMTVFENNLF